MGAVALQQLPDWPAAMPRDLALAYTGVADAQMKEWELRGLVRFRPRGPRGVAIASRASLDVALQALFSSPVADDGDIEFD
jgi:hypothetical protein